MSEAGVEPIRVIVVSGLSGAGKTTALKLLEDFGYEAVDNLPISLLRRLTTAEDAASPARRAMAVGVDSRTRDFQPDRLIALIGELKQRPDLDVQLLYFDCEDEILLKRFTATRRRHPLAADRPVADGIAAERHLMKLLQVEADQVFDTSTVTLPELRQLLAAQFALDALPGLSIMVLSFSYKLGLPREADLVFDVRFLRNPHYDDQLRPQTGIDPAVAAYVVADSGYADFFARLGGMISSLLPRYAAEGKRYLTIAIGCTGGRHRSVVVAEALGRHLREAGQRVDIRHRDRDLANA
ncbi:RNase adapter RapZ [Ferrovibrio sp.]|uniref:RNase adapter RapZ n=1 Tax=Ferrovibrio sp. TaxID=1917215 RepID=UPI00260E5648|nr:RNase adapter RapZ [Ferrovibrio sp.]